MKFVGLGLLSLFLFSFVNVAHSGILDTLLNTAKDIGAGVQRVGDDIIGAFVAPKDKPAAGAQPRPVFGVSSGSNQAAPYVSRMASDSKEVSPTTPKNK